MVSSIREWQAASPHAVNLHPSWIAKLKTTLQMLALTVLVGATDSYPIFLHVGVVLLTLSVCLSYFSLVDYVKKVYPVLTFSVKKQ